MGFVLVFCVASIHLRKAVVDLVLHMCVVACDGLCHVYSCMCRYYVYMHADIRQNTVACASFYMCATQLKTFLCVLCVMFLCNWKLFFVYIMMFGKIQTVLHWHYCRISNLLLFSTTVSGQ